MYMKQTKIKVKKKGKVVGVTKITVKKQPKPNYKKPYRIA